MKVFISWSGELSKQVAELLGEWIPSVIQGTKTWVSTQNIEKGANWFSEIQETLKDSGLGILCLTGENLNAPWILFEAGALSKGFTTNRVCPLLIGLRPSDLMPPLSQLNCVNASKTEMHKLLKMLNAQKGENKLPDGDFDKAFEKWWPDFETRFISLLENVLIKTAKPHRTQLEIIEEVLNLTRSIHGNMINNERLLAVEAKLRQISQFTTVVPFDSLGGITLPLTQEKARTPEGYIPPRYIQLMKEGKVEGGA